MIALSDEQLHAVMVAARPLDPPKRTTLMERVAARLRLTAGRYPTDEDVERALKSALAGLLHESAA